MNKLYIFLGVISALTSDYGIVGEFCVDLNPQHHLDVSKIEGIWYGSEVIQHLESYDGENLGDSCISIHIRETTDEQYTTRFPVYDFEDAYYNEQNFRSRRPQYNYVTLTWEEREEFIEYTLRYNTTRRGIWISYLGAEGDSPYNYFTNTVQVMKAVGDHLVLTFCENLPTDRLLTVILSRKPNTLTEEDLQNVRSLLRRRGLSISSIRKVCSSGSRSTVKLTFPPMLLLGVAFLFYHLMLCKF